MFRNNLKIALRSLLKQKIYTLINILGLSVGIASCILIVLYVRNEFSYDGFFANKEDIYRMVLERKYPNHSTFYAVVPHSFEGIIRRDFPEVEESVNVFAFQNFSLSYKNERDEVSHFDEDFVISTDNNFFKVFSFKLLKGNVATALSQANEIVVTEEIARRYFGNADPIGKVVQAGNNEFKVSGVMENIPENSHFKFSAAIAIATFPIAKQENFTSFSTYSYFKLKPGSDPAAMEAKIPKVVDTYAAAQIEKNLGKSWADYRKEGNGYRYFLQSLPDIHLDPINLESQMKPGGNRTSVYIMIFGGYSYSDDCLYQFHEPGNSAINRAGQRSWCKKSDGIHSSTIGRTVSD